MDSNKHKFNKNKKSLKMKENITSWNRGTKQKIIATPSNILTKSSRNGLILT